MFAPFQTEGGHPNPQAAVEQMTLIVCVGYNAQALALRLLGAVGGGTLLAWHFDEKSWPPSWALFRQGNNIYLSIYGTVNTQQWYGNVVGVFGRPYGVFPNQVHAFFEDAWMNVLAQVRPNLPDDYPTCNFKFIGHSYGGAVAFLGSTYWQRLFPAQAVEFWGFSNPKSLTTGYPGALAATRFLFADPADAVSWVPPGSTIQAVSRTTPLFLFGIPVRWNHYATCYTIDTRGNITFRDPSYFNGVVTPYLIGQTVVTHDSQRMTRQCVTWFQSLEGENASPAIVNLAETAAALEAVQDQNVNINIADSVNIPYQNDAVFLNQAGGALTPSNLLTVNQLTGGLVGPNAANSILSPLARGVFTMAVKATFFWNVNQAGLSESWYLPGPANPLLVPLAGLGTYIQRRLGVSGAQTQFDYVRLSSVGASRQVQVYYPEDFAAASILITPAPRSNGDSDFGGTALLIRKISGLFFSRFFLRGVSDNMIASGGLYKPTAAYAGYITSLQTFLVGAGYAWSGVGTPPNPPAGITTAVQNADQTIAFTLAGNLFTGVPIGNRVVVRISRQVAPRYLNGSYTVTVLAANQCMTIKPYPLSGFIAGTGRMSMSGQSYKVITALEVEKVVKRGPGRPSGLYRGRAKNRVTG